MPDIRYYYSNKSDRILALHPAGEIEVFEILEAADSSVENVEAPPEVEKPAKKGKLRELVNKKEPKATGGNTRKCGNCGEVGHQARKCPMSGRAAAKLARGQKDVFDPRQMDGLPPIDEHEFSLIKEKKAMDMTASEIAERYDLDHDVVADAMIAPDWIAYSSRYEKV